MNRPRPLLLFLISGLALLTGACGGGDIDRDLVVSVIQDEETPVRPIGTQLDYASATLRQSVATGLVTLDGEGRVIPGIAARWIVTEDALSYIFRLRDTRWTDGEEVTSDRVARLLRERVRELRRSRLAGQIEEIDEIKSMTGRVVEIRLKRPRPDFLQFLAQPEFGLIKGRVGVGPMVISGEDPLTLHVSATIAEDLALDEEETDASLILLKGETADSAVARFDLGYTDLVLGGRFNHLPLIEAADIDNGFLQFDPVAGLFGLRFLRTEGFWDEAANRRLLAMAIDRPAMLASFPVSAWQERLKIIPSALDPEGIDATPDWVSLTRDERREAAQSGIGNGANITPLKLFLPPGPGSAILLARLRADLGQTGLRVERVSDRQDAHAELIDLIAPYDGQRWFLDQFSCDVTPVCSAEADQLIDVADKTRSIDGQERQYARAETILVQHYNFIPLAVPIRWSLSRAGQAGFAVNPRGWHPLHPMIGIPIS